MTEKQMRPLETIPSQRSIRNARAKPHRTDAAHFRKILQNRAREADRGQSHPCGSCLDETSPEPESPKNFRLLGVISEKNPTVSHLLTGQPAFEKTCWQIVHAENNNDKPYTKMALGTAVYINPRTRELAWNHPGEARRFAAAAPGPRPCPPEGGCRRPGKPNPISRRLLESVEPYLGRSYKEIDCYELVVAGMKKMGIKYRGEGGLAEQLVTMAVDRGLSENAYLSGEGLISAAGSQLYAQKIDRIQDPERRAEEVIRELEPLLRKGAILAFSTPTRGHTGIISQKDGHWTFINSGKIDHMVGHRRRYEGVGEEILEDEVRNWLQRAARRNEPLEITLGELDERKLAAFSQNASLSTRV